MNRDLPQIQQVEILSRLVDISSTLNSTLELQPLLEYILSTAADLLDCDATSVMLYDEQADQLRFTAATGAAAKAIENIPIPLEGSIAGAVFKENRPIIVSDVPTDPRHFKQIEEQTDYSARNLLGVPMRIKDRKTGVIEALNKREGDFSEEDAQILTIMASQAAVAIHNAHVFNAMQKANQELRQANDFRQEFMGIASHELRTPLGIILGYVTLLKEDADERVVAFANSIFKATLQLRSLVEEMTIMNLLYTGATELNLTPTRIQDLLGATCDGLLEMAEVHKVDIVLNAPSLSFWVNADLRLKTAFVNIINNAIRFSSEGGRITIDFVMTDETIRVDIRDNGAGIDPDEIERIFDQFYQVGEHLTRQHGGLGLGLAIARAIVELHGGSVWAESEGLGHGSTFRVLLPRYYPQPQS